MRTPTPSQALEAARVAREAGRLRVALRALDHALDRLDEEPRLTDGAAREAEALGNALLERGAWLAALGELLRAQDVGREPVRALRRAAEDYSRWAPRPASIGVARETLKAGASGAFWIARGVKGRVLRLEGGITGESTDAFTRSLDLCAHDVAWLFIDMEKLSYVGSTGLAAAVKVAERLRVAGGGVCLFALSSNLKLLVETLGLARMLHPVDTLAEALDLAKPARR